MRDAAIVKPGTVQQSMLLLHRFARKLVGEVLPATLTSIVGGLLVAHYQFGPVAPASPAVEQAAPASAEMVQLVRDEHTAMMDYIKAQVAAEKSRNAAADAADARAAAEARAIIETPVPPPARAVPVAAVAPKPVAARSKPVVAAASLPPHEPLVVAQVVAQAAPEPAPVAQPAPQPEQKSLLARTLDLKDHVVGATLHAVSAIGGIPSWIASMGDHNDNADSDSAPVAPAAPGRSFAS